MLNNQGNREKIKNNNGKRADIRVRASILKPTQDFYFKSIRGDDRNYYHRFIEELINPAKRYKKRLGKKKRFTVRADGIFTRSSYFVGKYPLKPPQYTPNQKAKYTKFQSTTLGMPNFFSPVFGFDLRKSALAGLMFSMDNALPTNRLYIYDGGTVGRPYDHWSEADAEEYLKKKGTILFGANQLDEFKAAIQAKSIQDKHNEALVRLRLNCDDQIPMCDRDKIFIGSDNLESRLLAKQYADTLLKQLKHAGQCSDTYQIPVCFYTDSKDLLFKEYTEEEYKLDCEEAHLIYTNAQLKNIKYKNNRYEFLFALSPAEIHAELSHTTKGISFAMHLLQIGYVHIVKFLCEKSKFDLQDAFIKSLKAVDNKANFSSDILHRVISSEDEIFANNIIDWMDDPELIRQMNTFPNPLLTATEKNMIPCVNKLLKCNIDVNIGDNGRTALLIAAENGQLEVIKALLEDEHINVNLTTNENKTPLYIAAEFGHLDVIRMLLADKRVNVNEVATEDNQTALFIAAQEGHHEVVKALLEDERIHVNITSVLSKQLKPT
ncbi:MAG: ankyrin repeat domain-containing protein [Gammaproteobacteria bacterium]|nr:ankyrin repeat domain-containing protein [Gammaproteobacteria bacterium]MCW5582554.1 ankyrin repeat domain-containing protein [Gammaproteobacteria bacterium]